MSRPSRDEWALAMAALTAQRSTCLRRGVGCVLLNARGHVLSTGYNGVAAGLPHCNEYDGAYHLIDSPNEEKLLRMWYEQGREYPNACPGARSPSGSDLDRCQAIHAEQNALLQCRDVHDIHTCYVTASPCVTCTKLLLNTSCERIVFTDPYPHQAAKDLWTGAGRTWVHHDPNCPF